jgi:hypothetical protein
MEQLEHVIHAAQLAPLFELTCATGVTNYCHQCKRDNSTIIEEQTDIAVRATISKQRANLWFFHSLYFAGDPSISSVADAISKQSPLDVGDKCSVCNSVTQRRHSTFSTGARRTLPISALRSDPPSFLLVQLKRFLATGKLRRLIHVETALRFGAGLYDLIGVIAHAGEHVHSGHYRTFAARRLAGDRQSATPSSWFVFDDAHVEHVGTVEQALARATNGQDPYVLLYRWSSPVDETELVVDRDPLADNAEFHPLDLDGEADNIGETRVSYYGAGGSTRDSEDDNLLEQLANDVSSLQSPSYGRRERDGEHVSSLPPSSFFAVDQLDGEHVDVDQFMLHEDDLFEDDQNDASDD